MEYISEIQLVLDTIDERIKEKIFARELANIANFSMFHVCRIFQCITGMPVMLYVTRRKLQFALYDLSCNKKIIDVAMDYGFETHAGFTKAFKKCFGYPPSLYRMRVENNKLERVVLSSLTKNLIGGLFMHPNISEISPIVVVGYTSSHSMPDVKYTHDIPAYWESINMEYSKPLSKLHHVFRNSKHCEISVCFDADIESGNFTYLLGVGVDHSADLTKIEQDMHKMVISGGLYAKFTTPLVDSQYYPQSIKDTWKNILIDWLPNSEYEFDMERHDFEFYDERDHSWEHNNMVQMDIYVPIRKKLKR